MSNLIIFSIVFNSIIAIVGIIIIVIIYRRKRLLKNKEIILKKQLNQVLESTKEISKKKRLYTDLQYKITCELMTPLSIMMAPIKGWLEKASLPTNIIREFQLAYNTSISIQNGANQLLDIQEQIKNSEYLEVSSYKANIIANLAIRSFNSLINANPINIFYFKDEESNLEIWIDYKKINFILRNILSNAYRHINYNGTIWIRVGKENLNSIYYCTFSVTDDGKNPEPSNEYNSFENISYNAKDYVESREMGLSLMGEIASQHSGGIRVSRSQQGYHECTLFIPIGKEHFNGRNDIKFTETDTSYNNNEDINNINIVSNNSTYSKEEFEKDNINETVKYKKKILIIEDHKDIRLYFKIVFDKYYDVLMAENGKDGIDLALKSNPDVIICDIMMPVMDGFECCKIMKDNIKTKNIPIVMVTALIGEKDIIKGLNLGAEDYILKPFNPEILKTKVHNIIKKREEREKSYVNNIASKIIFTPSQEKSKDSEQYGDSFIQNVIKIIEENIQNPDFNVKKLADSLNMSQPTLYRKIKQNANYTIIELIMNVRIKKAAAYLKENKYTVQEVVEMVGYNDIPTFRKHFTNFYRVSPSLYSKQC